ncbi:MAG: hypothetical protein ACK4RK_07065 [Gemmataceae bacterium]
MRTMWILILASFLPILAFGQDKKPEVTTKRYGIDVDLKFYPQDTPQQTLASILKAVERGRLNYVLAQLADPKFVDERVRLAGGDFDVVIQEAKTKLADDPATVKLLQRFLKEGDWQVADTAAMASLKDVNNRFLFMKKIGDRWFMENKQAPDKE